MSGSGLAHAPASVSYQTSLVAGLLRGNSTDNIAAAVSVAVLYGLMMLVAVFNLVRERHKTHILLIIFGAIRVAAFSIRANMQKHLTEGKVIAYEVLFAVGFVALVKILYSLLMAWTVPDSRELSQQKAASKRGLMSWKPSLLRDHGTIQETFAFAALIAGAVCSIVGATKEYGSNVTLSEYHNGLTLMRAGYTIYLVVIAVFDIMCVLQPFVTIGPDGKPTAFHNSATKVSMMSGSLLVIGLLLTCKSVFQVIAVYCNPSLVFRNKLFYPLEVLPELLVLLILVIPGYMHQYLGAHKYAPPVGPAGRQNPAYEGNTYPQQGTAHEGNSYPQQGTIPGPHDDAFSKV